VWVAAEYCRYGVFGSFASILKGSHQHDYPGGFSWYFLGHSQHDVIELTQVADLTGVYGVCFLVAAVNALLFEILFGRAWIRGVLFRMDLSPRQGKTSLLIQGVCVAAALLSALGYGTWRLGQDTQVSGPSLALLQGNVDQRIKEQAMDPKSAEREKARDSLFNHYARLAGAASRERVDLIVWPETSFPGGWEEIAPGWPNHDCRLLAESLTDVWKTPMLMGMNATVMEHDHKLRSYNSAILLDVHGKWQGRYDKIHRVPFGEYVPLRSLVPWLNSLAPYDYDYSVSPGQQFTRFELPARKGLSMSRFGVVICYEDTDPAMSRPYLGSDGKPPVDFLLNNSNDGWFDGTSEHDQHLAICRFRAIECRRSIARAVNMGISAVIDSNGRVLAPTWSQKDDVNRWEVQANASGLPVSEWHNYKKVAGVLLVNIPIDSRSSFYARWGDWFASGCGGMLLLTLIGLRLQRFFRGTV
jgi:apolipoprotein N-acyltransferase